MSASVEFHFGEEIQGGIADVNKGWKKVVSRLSSVTLALAVLAAPLTTVSTAHATGSATTAVTQKSFVDVQGHWAESAISALAAKGIAAGKSPERFYPDDSLTRAEFATFLVRALELPLTQEAPPVFADVPQGSWMYPYVQAAYAHKLVSGVSETKFAPEAKISRQDMAKMIANALAVTEVPDEVKAQVQAFADDERIAGYAQEPVLISAYLGILSGYPNGTFQPLKNATRSEAAKTLFAMINAPQEKLDKLKPPAEPEPPKEPEPEPIKQAFLYLSGQNFGARKPTEKVELSVVLKDADGVAITEAYDDRDVTMTVKGPDGTQTLKAKSVQGIATFAVSKTKAGDYTLQFAAERAEAKGIARFYVVAGVAEKIDLHVAPSPFLKTGKKVRVQVTGLDKWNNPVPVGKVEYSVSDPGKAELVKTLDPMVANLTATQTTGQYTITATSGTFTDTQVIRNYAHAKELVAGKGDWMLWRDWKHYPVQDTIKRFKDAGVTHVYLHISTSLDGFFGRDAMEDFLPQAHEAGIVVIGSTYASLKDPYKDASQAVQMMDYVTAKGDKFDGLAADLEENLFEWQVETFSKTIRNKYGADMPMIAVVYPASWHWIAQPWHVYKKYYDVMGPMVYWHYKAKEYTYTEAYNAVKSEMEYLNRNTGLPVTMIGQSYNMFPDSWQFPAAHEIKGAMQAAKDLGAVGYSTYRGRTATDYEWAEFAKFAW